MITLRTLLAVAAIAIATVPASASEFPSSMTGDWCLIEEKSQDGWLWFKRSKNCEVDTFLVLKRNGDYVLTIDARDERCRATPKSFKGWTDYICTDHRGKTRKRNQKLLITTDEAELGLNR